MIKYKKRYKISALEDHKHIKAEADLYLDKEYELMPKKIYQIKLYKNEAQLIILI